MTVLIQSSRPENVRDFRALSERVRRACLMSLPCVNRLFPLRAWLVSVGPGVHAASGIWRQPARRPSGFTLSRTAVGVAIR